MNNGPFADLIRQLRLYVPESAIVEITRAFELAVSVHAGQYRKTGEPYVTHPVEVARILADLHMDPQTIVAALLHDTIEDTALDREAIRAGFGETVARLVEGVSKITRLNFEDRVDQEATNLRRMMSAMAQDLRVVFVKLADRLHNMRTLGALDLQKKRRIAKSTLEIYAPIARRLGMHAVCVELEDLSFSTLYPNRFRILKQAVLRARGSRREILGSIEGTIRQALAAIGIPILGISGREKHLYGLYRKMRAKHMSFAEVRDVYAVRVIVAEISECYHVLGEIHQRFKPIFSRFKDYIAIPKANGYQSLHTTLLGPNGIPLELQIRTEAMDRIAERGLAAHWLYRAQVEASDVEMRMYAWIHGLLAIHQTSSSPQEFMESVKEDLSPEGIYVFTPKGKILALPEGATAIDCAYAIHTDLGNMCVGARVDRALTPLHVALRSGQTIEILTDLYAEPQRDWLQYAVTGKARGSIRAWLRKQTTRDPLHSQGVQELPSVFGMDGQILSGRCCYPIPGDGVMGIREGAHVVVHALHCQKMARRDPRDPAHFVQLHWEQAGAGEYPVAIAVDVMHVRGALARVASSITGSDGDIVHCACHLRDLRSHRLSFLIAIRNREHLGLLMQRLQDLDLVTRVIRIC